MVGAYAMAIHGYPRSTMDIDLWKHWKKVSSIALPPLPILPEFANVKVGLLDLLPGAVESRGITYKELWRGVKNHGKTVTVQRGSPAQAACRG